jgi:hypothetical protein
MDQDELFRDLFLGALILLMAGYPIVSYILMQYEKYKEKKAKKRNS